MFYRQLIIPVLVGRNSRKATKVGLLSFATDSLRPKVRTSRMFVCSSVSECHCSFLSSPITLYSLTALMVTVLLYIQTIKQTNNTSKAQWKPKLLAEFSSKFAEKRGKIKQVLEKILYTFPAFFFSFPFFSILFFSFFLFFSFLLFYFILFSIFVNFLLLFLSSSHYITHCHCAARPLS
jgi:hypothetical protein